MRAKKPILLAVLILALLAVALIVPAVATGIPWIKASQAMGPFTNPIVRAVARFFLSRADALVARGASSERYLRALLPQSSIHRLPDVAFALRPAPDDLVQVVYQPAVALWPMSG